MDQADDPWWLADALCWLAMYQAIMGAWGKAANGWKETVKRELTRRPPEWLYEVYPVWCEAMRREIA